jgi:hypothetical protein
LVVFLRVKYFADTDTTLVEFADGPAGMDEFSYQRLSAAVGT